MKGTIISIKDLYPDVTDSNPYTVEIVIRVCPEYDCYEGSLAERDDQKAEKYDEIETFHIGEVDLTQEKPMLAPTPSVYVDEEYKE